MFKNCHPLGIDATGQTLVSAVSAWPGAPLVPKQAFEWMSAAGSLLATTATRFHPDKVFSTLTITNSDKKQELRVFVVNFVVNFVDEVDDKVDDEVGLRVDIRVGNWAAGDPMIAPPP